MQKVNHAYSKTVLFDKVHLHGLIEKTLSYSIQANTDNGISTPK